MSQEQTQNPTLTEPTAPFLSAVGLACLTATTTLVPALDALDQSADANMTPALTASVASASLAAATFVLNFGAKIIESAPAPPEVIRENDPRVQARNATVIAGQKLKFAVKHFLFSFYLCLLATVLSLIVDGAPAGPQPAPLALDLASSTGLFLAAAVQLIVGTNDIMDVLPHLAKKPAE
jgi:hypothetical protein